MRFSSEKELVQSAIKHLPLRRWLRVTKNAAMFQQTEVEGMFGIPDLVAAVPSRSKRNARSCRSIAFEMKLSDWRRGLAQAFRYRAFATIAVLVVDDSRSGPAVANLDRFKRANIGLVGLNPDGYFNTYLWPEREDPFNPDLQSALCGIVNRSAPSVDRPMADRQCLGATEN